MNKTYSSELMDCIKKLELPTILTRKRGAEATILSVTTHGKITEAYAGNQPRAAIAVKRAQPNLELYGTAYMAPPAKQFRSNEASEAPKLIREDGFGCTKPVSLCSSIANRLKSRPKFIVKMIEPIRVESNQVASAPAPKPRSESKEVDELEAVLHTEEANESKLEASIARADRTMKQLEVRRSHFEAKLRSFLTDAQIAALSNTTEHIKWPMEVLVHASKLMCAIGEAAYSYLVDSKFPLPPYAQIKLNQSAIAALLENELDQETDDSPEHVSGTTSYAEAPISGRFNLFVNGFESVNESGSEGQNASTQGDSNIVATPVAAVIDADFVDVVQAALMDNFSDAQESHSQSAQNWQSYATYAEPIRSGTTNSVANETFASQFDADKQSTPVAKNETDSGVSIAKSETDATERQQRLFLNTNNSCAPHSFTSLLPPLPTGTEQTTAVAQRIAFTESELELINALCNNESSASSSKST